MAEKVTVVDTITIQRNGVVEVRASSYFSENDKPVSNPEYHRFALEPGTDPEAMRTALNDHMPQLGKPKISDADWARVLAHVNAG
jgi:hypothetical protein